MDSEGQVDRFMRRLEKRQELLSETGDTDPRRKAKRRREKRAIVEIVDQEGEVEAVAETAPQATN